MIEKTVSAAKRAFRELRDFWHTLPQWAQAGGVVFAAAAGASLGKRFTESADFCWQWVCIKHYLGSAGGAGVVALRAFYMRPGPGPKAVASRVEISESYSSS